MSANNIDAELSAGAEREARLRAENAKLREALTRFLNSGCPDCGGDCGSANPPVSCCIMLEARAALSDTPAPASGTGTRVEGLEEAARVARNAQREEPIDDDWNSACRFIAQHIDWISQYPLASETIVLHEQESGK